MAGVQPPSPHTAGGRARSPDTVLSRRESLQRREELERRNEPQRRDELQSRDELRGAVDDWGKCYNDDALTGTEETNGEILTDKYIFNRYKRNINMIKLNEELRDDTQFNLLNNLFGD